MHPRVNTHFIHYKYRYLYLYIRCIHPYLYPFFNCPLHKSLHTSLHISLHTSPSHMSVDCSVFLDVGRGEHRARQTIEQQQQQHITRIRKIFLQVSSQSVSQSVQGQIVVVGLGLIRVKASQGQGQPGVGQLGLESFRARFVNQTLIYYTSSPSRTIHSNTPSLSLLTHPLYLNSSRLNVLDSNRIGVGRQEDREIIRGSDQSMKKSRAGGSSHSRPSPTSVKPVGIQRTIQRILWRIIQRTIQHMFSEGWGVRFDKWMV